MPPKPSTKKIAATTEDIDIVNGKNSMLTAFNAMESSMTCSIEETNDIITISRELGADYAGLKATIGNWGKDALLKREVTWNSVSSDRKGNRTIILRTEMVTKTAAKELLVKIENSKKTYAEMAKKNRAALLVKYKGYSLAIATISNMMKQLNDEKMKIISNMKA